MVVWTSLPTGFQLHLETDSLSAACSMITVLPEPATRCTVSQSKTSAQHLRLRQLGAAICGSSTGRLGIRARSPEQPRARTSLSLRWETPRLSRADGSDF